MSEGNEENLDVLARQLLQEFVQHGGWAYFGDYGECLYCGAGGDGFGSRFHQEGCRILRAQKLAAQLLARESHLGSS